MANSHQPKEDDVRTRLIVGGYQPPVVKPGDWLKDAIDGRVEVGGYTRALVPWPRRMKAGKPSVILCGDLIRAVRTESAVAIAHHFGVSSGTVAKWRVALGVDRKNNEGTVALYKGLTPSLAGEERAAQRRGASDADDQTSAMAQHPWIAADETSAERKRKMRQRKAERGEKRCSIDLTIEALQKVDRAAEAAGLSRTVFVNALLVRSLP